MKSRNVGMVLALPLVVGVTIWLGGCGSSGSEDPWANVSGGSPRVLVAFPPLYCFAKNVAGDEVAVLSLLTTVGPHDYKPNNQDALAVRKARVFFANGLGLDNSLAKVVNSAADPSLRFVNVGNLGVPKERRIKIGKVPHGDHFHEGTDPHAWLGIEEAIGMVEVIRDTLKEVDAKRAPDYEKRAAAYIEKLKQLQEEGKKSFAGKKNRNLVTNHDSLAYFARSFDLNIVGHVQTQPGVTVDAKHLEGLAALCRENNVRVLAVEPQYPRASMDLLKNHLQSKDMSVVVVELDPIETAAPDQLDAGYYERVMRANLETLAKHLP